MLKIADSLFFAILIDDKMFFLQVINITPTIILNCYRQSHCINGHFISWFFHPYLVGLFLSDSGERGKKNKNQGQLGWPEQRIP